MLENGLATLVGFVGIEMARVPGPTVVNTVTVPGSDSSEVRQTDVRYTVSRTVQVESHLPGQLGCSVLFIIIPQTYSSSAYD
jgi:hypothetical protein